MSKPLIDFLRKGNRLSLGWLLLEFSTIEEYIQFWKHKVKIKGKTPLDSVRKSDIKQFVETEEWANYMIEWFHEGGFKFFWVGAG